MATEWEKNISFIESLSPNEREIWSVIFDRVYDRGLRRWEENYPGRPMGDYSQDAIKENALQDSIREFQQVRKTWSKIWVRWNQDEEKIEDFAILDEDSDDFLSDLGMSLIEDGDTEGEWDVDDLVCANMKGDVIIIASIRNISEGEKR